MASRNEATLPAMPRSRKSLAHLPSSQILDQENMTADIGALGSRKRDVPIVKLAKKSRSKSIGPGGLDALKDTTGNRRKSLATISHPPPKSILKPTMPSLREIPAHISSQKGSPKKATPRSPQKSGNLIDFDVRPASATKTGTNNLPNPFQADSNSAGTEERVILRTEEEQQASAREREEKEREELEKETISRRDARRKSLANRRVSFAPEATLHTWDVVIEYQDSTTSSNATNSTRRASSVSHGTVASPHPQTRERTNSEPSEPPSTPPEQVEEATTVPGPAKQRDLHQKKQRRSSGIPPMNFNNPEDENFSESPYSGSSADDIDDVVGVEDMDDSNSNSDSDEGDETGMSIDGATDMSLASIKSVSSSESSSRLNNALREAARLAGTQGIDFDEIGEQEVTEEVVASFTPWMKPAALQNLESQQDQENVNPFSAATNMRIPTLVIKQNDLEDVSIDMTMDITMDMTRPMGGIISEQPSNDDEMSMDVTRALGGIITNSSTSTAATKRKSVGPNHRQSLLRKSISEDFSMGDETMDFTMAVGSIQQAADQAASEDEDDVTMEFTTVVGGIFPKGKSTTPHRQSMPVQKGQKKRSRESLYSKWGDETMDVTAAVGGIMSSIVESRTEEQDATMGMEMTTALGNILLSQPSTGSRAQAKKIMELETDLGSSPFQTEVVPNSPPKSSVLAHTIASDTESPSLSVFRAKGTRRSTELRRSMTPKPNVPSEDTPVKKLITPPKQLTPQPVARPTTPSKTPRPKNVDIRSASPKKLFRNEVQVSTTPGSTHSAKSKKVVTPNKLFRKDRATGNATPGFVLTPQRRFSTGVGLDREGLGSPHVAALLDRRTSISELAKPFTPSRPEDVIRGVRFDNPMAMEEEIDKEREQEANRENGRRILEREADQGNEEKDATLNLREMIESLTPKKKSMKPRKSLHVGAAKGILGKRPVELDEDDDDDDDEEDNGGVKRLKDFQGSPVKNVKLQAPPSKAETTGRVARASRKSLEDINKSLVTPTTISPRKIKPTTPQRQGRFIDAEAKPSSQEVGRMSEKEPVEEPQIDEETLDEERIQLQDFLNMTSIRFMDLTTTKRRHTIAPKSAADSKGMKNEFDLSLEDCVAAGVATTPMLELFQHACRELKRYISEGRKTVREIETDTFEENPPLFREYISATPDMRVVMDNQLKNVKTHARLLSKEMWYNWRMILLSTVKEGLFKTGEGMIEDEEIMDHQQELLNSILPMLVRKAEALEQEEADLRAIAEDLANCDPQDLSDARQELITVDADIETKKRMISDLKKQLGEKEAGLKSGVERKQICIDEIREAENIREECRGWTSGEIRSLKAKVDMIEKEHGWAITGISGTTTSMTYQKDIELVFDAASFLPSQAKPLSKQSVDSRIDLWYIGANREFNPQPLTPEKEFFLQSIRDHVRGLAQAQTNIKDLLKAVSVSWNKASAVVGDIRLLNISCPIEIAKTSDNSISIKSMLLISPLTTKVEVIFHLSSHSRGDGIDVEVSPSAAVVYGERFNEPKMAEFLINRCGNIVEEKAQSKKMPWGNAVAELGEKLLARGRK